MNGNLAFQDEIRQELIQGELVAMSPSPVWRHVAIAGNIFHIFRSFLDGKKCVAIPDGFDLHLTEDNVFVPDMMVVCDRSKIKSNGVYGAPDLVVEVLSPSTAKNDRSAKKDVYESCGVEEYWIVDPAGRSIEVYRLKNGRYEVSAVHYLRSPDEVADMKEEERAALVTSFKCHLYDDLTIQLTDVFDDLFFI